MQRARTLLMGVVCLAPVAAAWADGGEELLSRAEALAGRALDARFRAAAAAALAQLTPEELERREETVHTSGIGPLAIGDSNVQLVYTPITPCRIADTRAAGGSLAAGTVREFRVTGGDLSGQGGSATGCNVPTGPATSAIINFVAVNAVGPGNLRAWAYSSPPMGPPTASILNYASVGLNIANGIAVPICNLTLTSCPYDLRVQADVSGTHLVADVVGYFERFPKEQARSFSVVTTPTNFTGLGLACTHVAGAAVTVTAPVGGRILVEAHIGIEIQHTGGSEDGVFVWIRPDSTTCGASGTGGARARISSGIPSGALEFTTVAHAVFNVAPGTYTYYLNGARSGVVPSLLDMMMIATFQPN